MKNISYVQQSSLKNLAGRIDYISSPERQEHLYATYDTAPSPVYWNALAKENQRDFLKHGTNGKCIEAREFIIALPPPLFREDHEELLRHFAEGFKERYGVECTAALHHNKAMTNFHIHLIYSERKSLENPEVKVATRNRYYNPEGRYVRTKKEAADEKGNLLPGYTMIPKGEVYEGSFFEKKDPMFKSKEWLHEAKTFFTEMINERMPERDQMQVFPKNSPYLPTKKIGKNNPRAEDIRRDNELREGWNKKVDVLRQMRVPQESMRIVKRRLVTEPVREARQQAGGKDQPHIFQQILNSATRVLGTMIRHSRRMSGQE